MKKRNSLLITAMLVISVLPLTAFQDEKIETTNLEIYKSSSSVDFATFRVPEPWSIRGEVASFRVPEPWSIRGDVAKFRVPEPWSIRNEFADFRVPEPWSVKPTFKA